MLRNIIAVTMAGGLALAAPLANAATFFEGEASLSITLVTKGLASVTVATSVNDVITSATGGIGTNAAAFGDDIGFADGPLDVGNSFSLEATARGGTPGNVAVASNANAFYDWDGALTITGAPTTASKVVFEGLYSLSTVATLDDPALETAFATATITVGDLTVLIDTIIGGGPLSGVPFSFTVDLAAGETKTVALDMVVSGYGTAVPAAVPLPAAAPLLLAGLGVLGFVARRRRA